jgi:thiol-disulfide isomerase/thioredoxin
MTGLTTAPAAAHDARPRSDRRAGRAVAALAVFGLAGVLAGAAPARAARPDPSGAAAIRRALEGRALAGLDGRTISLDQLRGEVVVLNFWASWCRPCRKELPVLDALHAEIAPRGGRVIAVSIDEERGNAQRFSRALRLAMPVVHDGPDGLARTLDLDHVPFTVVLDRGGAVAFTTSGSDEASLHTLGETVRRLVARAPLAGGSTEGDVR